MSQPVVFITPEELREKPGPWVESLVEAGFVVRYPRDRRLTAGTLGDETTVAELQEAGAVIAGGEHYTPGVIRRLEKLRVIARCGVGYDRVDLAAATARQVAVTITPTANHECVAEHALALMLAAARSIALNDRRLRGGLWQRTLHKPLRRGTLGVVGLGRIGRSVTVRALALGMRVIAVEHKPDMDFVERHGVELVSLDALLERSDFVTIHCPLNDQTRGMFDRAAFDKMRDDSILVNTARGPLVVEADLIDALRERKIGAAGLDVFETEPTPADNPLLQLENVVASPHVGGADTLSIRNMAVEAAGAILQLARSEWPEEAVVNPEVKAGWRWQP